MPFDPTQPFEVIGESAGEKPAFDPSQPFESIPDADRITALAKDDAHDPLSHAAQFTAGTPEYIDAIETGYDVAAKRKELGIGPGFGETALGAAKGVGKFFLGAGAAVGETGTGAIVRGLGNLSTDPNYKQAAYNEAEKHRANSLLQGQTAEMGATHTVGLIDRAAEGLTRFLAPKMLSKEEIQANPSMRAVKERWDAKDANPRKYGIEDFTHKAEDARKTSSIATGQVQDTGLLAQGIKSVSGSSPSEIYTSPEDLAAKGVERTAMDQLSVESGGAGGDPAMFVYSAIPAIPGTNAVLRGAGKAAEVVGGALPKLVKKLGPTGKAITAAAGTTAAGIAAYHGGAELVKGVITHPLEATAGLGLAATLLATRRAGTFAREAGELGSGIIPREGASAFGLNAKLALSGAIPGAIIGGGIGAMDDDVTGGAVSGALFGAAGGATARVKGIQNAASARESTEHGSTLKTGNKAVDATHDTILSAFTPEQQAAINRRKSALAGDGVQLVVTDKVGFDAARAANGEAGGENAAGMFVGDNKHIVTTGPNGSKTIYLNAETIGGKADPGGKAIDVSGHEIGHAVENYLTKADGGVAAIELRSAVEKALTPDDVKAIRDAYQGDIAKRGGEPPSVDVTSENIAEITRKILNKEDISSFAVPRSVTDKISDSVSEFFSSQTGDSAGMHWGTKEVTKAKALIRDALFEQGQRAFDIRQRGRDVESGKIKPTETEDLANITTRQREIAKLPPEQVTEDVNKEWDALMARKRAIEKRRVEKGELDEAAPADAPKPIPVAPVEPAPATEAPPSAPVTPAAPITPEPIPATPAPIPTPVTPAPVSGPLPWLDPSKAPKAKPASVDIDPNVAPVAPVVNPNVEPARPASSAPEINVEPAAKKNELPAIAVEDPTLSAKRETPVDELPLPELPIAGDGKTGADVPVAPIQERIAAARKAADEAGEIAAAKARTPHTKEAAKKRERVKALEELLPDTGEELRRVTDLDTGKTVIKGMIDPANPLHAAILAEHGHTPAQIETVLKSQENKDKGVYFRDYNSAKQEGHETGEGLDLSGKKRAAELAASRTSKERGKRLGEVTKQDKAVTPYDVVMTKDGLNIRTFDHDKFLDNTRKVLDVAKEKGETTGFEGLVGAKLDLAVAQTYRAVGENHKNGWKGDGSAPMKSFPTSPIKVNPDYIGKPVDKARADTINMAMHIRPIGVVKEGAKNFERKADLSRENTGLAEMNEGFLNPETGETNRLRDALERKGFLVKDQMKETISNIRPDLIEGGISDTPTHGRIVHAHGFDIAPSELTVAGRPVAKQVRAGFSPDVESSSVQPKMMEKPKFGLPGLNVDLPEKKDKKKPVLNLNP